MPHVSYRTQLTTELDINFSDWTRVKEYCETQGSMFQTIDEFAERVCCDFWKATPKETDGLVLRELEFATFIEESDGFTHRLSQQHIDLYGDITITISKELDAEKVEKIA